MFKNNLRFINSFLQWPLLPWLTAMVVHSIAAYFSFGYHHPDEHYQIWEFANFFAGVSTDKTNLPWEYFSQIRPWLQPLLHAGLIRSLHWFNFNSFDIALIARELYAIFNLAALYFLWREFKLKAALKFNAALCAWLIATLWFLPYVHVRTSSENLAAIFITLGFAQFMRAERKNSSFYLVGLLLGFSFLARYQIALGLLGLGIALLLKDKKITRDHVSILAGFLIAVTLGVFFDAWGYSIWQFTPYVYFKVNILQGVSATFNPYPFYQYFIWMLELNPFISIPILVGIIRYIQKQKFDPIVGFMSAFFLLHCLMSNKEYRFLFPILNFLPFMMAVGWSQFYKKSWAFFNIPAFIVSSLRTASYTVWPLLAFHHFVVIEPTPPSQRWLTNQNSYHGLYYEMPKNFNPTLFSSIENFKPAYESTPKPLWVMWDDRPNNPTFEPLFTFLEANCEVKETSLPRFIYESRFKIQAVQRLQYQVVYFCQ